jgi:hypothetical protein
VAQGVGPEFKPWYKKKKKKRTGMGCGSGALGLKNQHNKKTKTNQTKKPFKNSKTKQLPEQNKKNV